MHASVLDILRLCAEDPEETLFELGFGCDEPQFNIRIPSRFFTFPSQAKGINFRCFLDSQLQRIRDEDPSLTLASKTSHILYNPAPDKIQGRSKWPFSCGVSGRFRQVQVLTAMANAFYSLYSHVSRTPLQKLAPPEFTFYSSPVERMERFRSNIRSEPRSPVERLKDTVSKMCLYTGSPRGSESTSPQSSPKKRCSLSDVGDFAREKVQPGVVKNLRLGESIRNNSTADVRSVASDNLHIGSKTCCIKNKNAVVDGNYSRAVSVDNKTQGSRTSLSLETADRADTGTPVATAAPEDALCCCRPKPNTASHICCEAGHGHAPVQISRTTCCMTVTGWVGEDIKSCSPYAGGSHHASTVPASKTGEESLHERDIRYLTPLIHQSQDSISSNLKHVNSFELEEVHYSFEITYILNFIFYIKTAKITKPRDMWEVKDSKTWLLICCLHRCAALEKMILDI